MPLLSKKEVLNLKLNSIDSNNLKLLAQSLEIFVKNKTRTKIIEDIMSISSSIDIALIDNFIKSKYDEIIKNRENQISDNDLKLELSKVKTFSWGIVQGQLDQKIQAQYVRKYMHYDELINIVKSKLHSEITNYVICTWFNHWTTVLIEDHISKHPKVIPTLKNIKGIDIFFGGQPFDLKISYLPKDYDIEIALKYPYQLAKWLYENQGIQRFGADNRFYVILLDKDNPDKSWELKRDFELVFSNIDKFLDREKISSQDEIIFSYQGKTYTAVTKILLITK